MSGSGADSASSASGACTRTIQPGGRTADRRLAIIPTAVTWSLPCGSATINWPPTSSTGSRANTPRSTSRSYSTRVQRRTVSGAWAMAVSVGSAPTDVNVNDRAHATAAPRRRSLELRVQEIAQRVPEQVHGEDRDGDRRPGEDDHPPRRLEGLG